MDKSAIFIDGAYVDKLLQNHFGGARINYNNFVHEIAAGSDILRTYYYHCRPYVSNPPTQEEKSRLASKQRFFDAISKLSRFQLRFGRLEKRGSNPKGEPIFVQKRVDIMIGVDMVKLAATGQINKAILVAGDSDLLPAVEATKPSGVLVQLWHGPRGAGTGNTVHKALWEECDERAEITRDLIDRIRQ